MPTVCITDIVCLLWMVPISKSPQIPRMLIPIFREVMVNSHTIYCILMPCMILLRIYENHAVLHKRCIYSVVYYILCGFMG